VPLRAAPEFAVTLKVVVPDPVREAPSATTIQSAAETAVQAQVGADAVTAIEPEPPVLARLCVLGEMVNVHGAGGGAACDTVKVCAPIVSVPVRAAAVLAAAVKVTVPLPVPEAPPVIVSHAAFAAAVQAQVVADAVTATVPDPPVSAMFWLAGESVNVQVGGGGGAACVTVKVFPAAAMVPVRALLVVLAATLNATLPAPVPEAPAVMLIHGALVAAVHAHVFADAVTAIEPAPPAWAKFCVDGEIENVHAGGGAAA
jgi:hypothetical protein